MRDVCLAGLKLNGMYFVPVTVTWTVDLTRKIFFSSIVNRVSVNHDSWGKIVKI